MNGQSASPGAAIITGGGYGIGRAVAELLAADGWRLIIVDRDIARAEETCARVAGAGGHAIPLAGNVALAETANAAIARVRASGEPLRGLVTCAAMRHEGPITAISEAQWDETLDVVLKGVFLFCKAAISLMQEQGGGGSIVNVSSPDSYGRKNMVAYAAAKAGVNALSACLAADQLADRIRVNVVHPGFTLSGMTEHYAADRLDGAAARSVAGRLALPEDVAGLIRFLMSATGETFTGGIFGAQPIATR
jgi:NAD(P)-dependent dehydrogenase (short-subunit alcohol dehydrogenase family)